MSKSAAGERDSQFANAMAAHAAGRLDESEQLLRRLVEFNAGDWEAQLFHGIILGKLERNEEAAQTLSGVLRAMPDSFEAMFWFSIVARRSGDFAGAVEFARKAATAQPNSPFAQNNLGFCEMDCGHYEQAIHAFSWAVRLRPDNATTYYNLAGCLVVLGREEDALAAYKSAVALAPKNLQPRLGLAKTKLVLNDLKGAARESRAAIALDPNSSQAHATLAMAKMHLGDADMAREHIAIAAGLDPADATVYAKLGSILQSVGEIDASNDAFLKSIDLDPHQGHAYFGLVFNKRITEEDRMLLVTMEALVEKGGLPVRELASLHYALGKGFEGVAEYEKAMSHFDEANRISRKLKFGDLPYDAAGAAASTHVKIARYTQGLFEASAGFGLESDVPIFVVGMMRSGTTLVEQIFSSHPNVAAAGEQEFWTHRGLEALTPDGQIDFQKLQSLGTEYLALLANFGPAARHVTDKMPGNYLSLGLIHAAFPNARIIHTRRNPADTGLSIYVTPNRARVNFAHSKETIASAYLEYWKLMEHWREVLPSDRFLEVTYEDIIADQDGHTRLLADFCGLAWDDAMLHPESNERAVVTPSAWQVRQPLYRTSMERWRRYEPWLGPLKDLLDLPNR